jgi:hypothetical protein
VEALKESSSRFMRRMFPSSMLGLSFDGAGSAVAEKRKIQAKDSRSSMPLTMKWRYKRVWRKRALMLLVFTVALYQFYKAFEFNGVDLARVPGSWLGGSSNEAGEPSSKYMRSTMEKKTSNSNPTGRANAPLSSKSKSKKQQRVKSSASKNSLHPISRESLLWTLLSRSPPILSFSSPSTLERNGTAKSRVRARPCSKLSTSTRSVTEAGLLLRVSTSGGSSSSQSLPTVYSTCTRACY